MYIVTENIVDGDLIGYIVTEKIAGNIIESHYIDPKMKTCSCRYFAESHNPYSHFHINLCKHWIRMAKPKSALFGKSKDGKIVTLCAGFVVPNNNKV